MTDRTLTNEDGQVIDPDAFTDWLEDYPKGQLKLELSEALAACVNASQLYVKPSTFTLKVTMVPGEGFYGEMVVKTDVKSTPARPAAPTATFFPTAAGGLSRRDPNQPQIPGTETT